MPTVPTYRAYNQKHLGDIPQIQGLHPEQRLAIEVVASVLPFRVNSHVIESLINWDDVPNDPIFRLTFPQKDMLSNEDFNTMAALLKAGANRKEIHAAAQEIRQHLNPHPAGQLEKNVPQWQDEPLPGVQHKYRETLLFFPLEGQTCHAYCTYCFRWAQFVGDKSLKFASRDGDTLVDYLHAHPEVTDVLFTGGDPMIMKTSILRRYIEPLLAIPSLRTIRIGTKALAWWPYRFTTDKDSDDLMALFEEVVAAGKHLAVMAHVSHPRELTHPAAEAAFRRIRSTGAEIRCQAPLIRGVNDDPEVWASMWKTQIRLGAIPYYFFVERDTGPKNYFEVPLARALDIYTQAYQQVSGLARTVRGPSMSCTPGKVLIDGVATVAGEKVFVLKFIQGRDAAWGNQVFFAKYDEKATWFTDLVPAFGAKRFFFERNSDPGLSPVLSRNQETL